MARVAHGDLLGLYEALGAATHPNTTEVPKLIIELYKEAYTVMYPGSDKYDSADANDDETLILNNYTFAVIRKETESLVRLWYLMSIESPPPDFELSKEGKKELASIAARIRGKISNIQLWGGPIYDIII